MNFWCGFIIVVVVIVVTPCVYWERTRICALARLFAVFFFLFRCQGK